MFMNEKISPLTPALGVKTARVGKSIIFIILVATLIISQSGCTPLFDVNAADSSSKSLVDIQNEVNTAVAATLVGFYVEETQSAAKLAAVASTEPPTADPPTPTPTTAPPQPTPTNTEIPASAVAPVPPVLPVPAIVTLAPVNPSTGTTDATIWASINTNCRLGPSTLYPVDGYLTVGITSRVHGSDSAKNWWYIEHPQKTGQFCWVWSSTTHIEGNVSGVPVVAVAPAPQPLYNPYANYSYNYGYNYGYYPYGYGCNSLYPPTCYCPCKTKKLTCNQKKKWWCYTTSTCKCKMVCTPSCQNPCNIPNYPILDVNCKNSNGLCGH